MFHYSQLSSCLPAGRQSVTDTQRRSSASRGPTWGFPKIRGIWVPRKGIWGLYTGIQGYIGLGIRELPHTSRLRFRLDMLVAPLDTHRDHQRGFRIEL